MATHHRLHRRFLSKRQDSDGILGNLFPGSSDSASNSGSQSSQQSTSSGSESSSDDNPLDPNVIASEFSDLFGGASSSSSAVLPSSGPFSATTIKPLTNLSSSSTRSITTSPTSSVHTPSSSSASPATASPASTLATSATVTSATAPTSTPSVSDVVYTSSQGTSIVYITSAPSAASASTTAVPAPSFLHDPSLEGGVFALVGIASLIIVFAVVTWTIRKRRRDRLEKDAAVAVTFDPAVTDRYEQEENSMEKRRLSGSSSGHGQGHDYGYGVRPAYAPPQEYPAPGYGQYPAAAYHAPSSNLAPYQVPTPTVPQPAAQGGANLTRKFSDRKPVPPLLLTPGYDSTNGQVSIPPHLYQQ